MFSKCAFQRVYRILFVNTPTDVKSVVQFRRTSHTQASTPEYNNKKPENTRSEQSSTKKVKLTFRTRLEKGQNTQIIDQNNRIKLVMKRSA